MSCIEPTIGNTGTVSRLTLTCFAIAGITDDIVQGPRLEIGAMQPASASPVVQRCLAVKGQLLRRRRRPHARPVDQQGPWPCSVVTWPALRMLPWSTTDGIALLAGMQMRPSRGVRSTSLRRIEEGRLQGTNIEKMGLQSRAAGERCARSRSAQAFPLHCTNSRAL